ncbi:MAG: xylulokinase [Planctomycetes bacterium]|nr:xylulokinase [Planctomycetota bacterium]
MTNLFLGFDVGTQSCKALVIDAERREVVARAQEPLELLAGLPPGHMEQHPDRWIDAVQRTARDVLAAVDGAEIAGIGVSGQQHGCVVLDDGARVVRPAKLWCDTATSAEAARLRVPTGFTASKLLWLKEQEPHHWQRVRRVLLPHDYVNFVLTGAATMECGDASGTGFFDPHRRAFDAAAMAAIDDGLPALLPPLSAEGALAGRLSARGAELLGLPAGIPVAAGGGDNMMSAIGAGATRPGVVVVSLGTSGTIFTRADRPVVDPEGLIAPFCSSDGAWLPLCCVMNLTGVTEEIVVLTGLDHATLTAAASAVPPGADGLLWLPFLLGERVPDLPNATGTLLGIRPGTLRPGQLYRAALEGTSLNLGAGLDRMRRLGLDVDEVRLVGGAARNPLWRAILAAVFRVPVEPLAEAESAALGAAIQALWSVRRLEEPGLTVDEVAQPFVRTTGARTAPEPELVAHYASAAARFAAAVALVHGAGTAR